MDEKIWKQMKEMICRIEPDEEAKTRILKNLHGKRRKKTGNRMFYVAAAAALICILAVNGLNGAFQRNQVGIKVYAASMGEDEWMELSVGEKKQLQKTEETCGYTFRVELTDGQGKVRTETAAGENSNVSVSGNTIAWKTDQDTAYGKQEPDKKSVPVYVTKDGKQVGEYVVVLTEEGGTCCVELQGK